MERNLFVTLVIYQASLHDAGFIVIGFRDEQIFFTVTVRFLTSIMNNDCITKYYDINRW